MCFNNEFREPYVWINVLKCHNSSNSGHSAEALSRWQRYSRIIGGFHLEAIHGVAGLGIDKMIAGIAGH